MAGLQDFIVDWRSVGSAEGAAALRACLGGVEDEVTQYECDLPDRELDGEAREARAMLLAAARRPRTDLPATGVLKADDAALWDAFVTFAPHALDGSVWTRTGDGSPCVSFSDEGTSISVRVDPQQAGRLRSLLPDGVALVPIEEWRARTRRR